MTYWLTAEQKSSFLRLESANMARGTRQNLSCGPEQETRVGSIQRFVHVPVFSWLPSELGDNLRREKYLRQQQSPDVAGLLSLFEKPDTAKLVREVAIALMGGHYVCIPCAGGGSVSSETGWDGRKKDEEDENFRLRCWLHAAKSVKNSRKVQTKRKGYRA